MKQKKPLHRSAMVRFQFGDGTYVDVPLVDHEKKMQRQYHAMANSEDPYIQELGKRKLNESADAAAAKQFADYQNAIKSKKPRPAARSVVREKIKAAMRPYKRDGSTFKEFMSAWGEQPLAGLSLTAHGEDYIVDDENETDNPRRSYKWSTLQTLYSEA